MYHAYHAWGIAAITVIPLSILAPYVAVVVAPFLFIVPTKVTLEVNQMLKSGTAFELPQWINECSRSDQQISEEQFDINDIEKTVARIGSLANCLVAYQILSAIAIFMMIWALCAWCYLERKKNERSDKWTKPDSSEKTPKEP